jgi:hypothetical protein
MYKKGKKRRELRVDGKDIPKAMGTLYIVYTSLQKKSLVRSTRLPVWRFWFPPYVEYIYQPYNGDEMVVALSEEAS